jgi:methyltransferase (TIGR00027 family)
MKLLEEISDTARWVAVFRALESERKDALFRDPFARELAGERGFQIARRLPGGGAAAASAVVVRTAVIDYEVKRAVADGADAVLSLAAGLDARPWRLQLPEALTWIEVDLPGSVAYKQGKLAGRAPRCRLTSIGQDLADRAARRALLARVAGEHRRVLVLTEGLLGYLETAEVEALADDLHAHPSLAWWITDFLSPPVVAYMRRRMGRHLAEGRAEIKFAPPGGMTFFERHGWKAAELRFFVDDAVRLHREPLSGKLLRLALSLAPSARRETVKREKLPGVVRLERSG